MKQWQLVLMQELRNQFRRKAYLFSAFGVPLLVLMGFGGYLFYDELNQRNQTDSENTLETEFENEQPIGYIDLTGAFPSPSSDSPFHPYIAAYPDFARGEAALKNNDISRLYVIEENYFERGRVTMWIAEFSLSTIDNGLLEAFLLTSMAGDTDPYVIARLRVPTMQITENRILEGSDSSRTGESGQNFWVAYVFALLLMITTFSASGYLMQTVVEEKENLTIEIILTSVKPLALLIGKTLAMGLTGLLQTLLWVATIFFVASQLSVQFVDFDSLEVQPMTAAFAVIYFLLGFGFLGGFFAAIGSLINSTREGSAYSSVITLPSVIPFFFISAITEDPHSPLAVALSLIPFTAPMSMMMRLSLVDVPIEQIALSMGLLVVGIIFAMWLAARLFRVNSLLRGNLPKLREIPKLIFQG